MNTTLEIPQSTLSTASADINPASDASSVNRVSDAVIDPALRHAQFEPAILPSGERIPRAQFEAHLDTINRRAPFFEACDHFEIRYPKTGNLQRLRAVVSGHWYGSALQPAPPAKSKAASTSTAPTKSTKSAKAASSLPSLKSHATQHDEDSEEALMREYDYEGMGHEIFGALGTGGLEDVDQDEDDEEEDDSFAEDDLQDDEAYKRYQTATRVKAAQRWEDNRRKGGRKTQASVEKSWNVFLSEALAAHRVRDDIVDEHALLLFIEHTATRCRRNRRGEYIPNTRVGAAQIKKEFFGALRIRKQQDALDPTLKTVRPATTVHVYDAVKTRMDEALRNARDGLIPGEDAPDIVANTFLEQMTDETLQKIGYGFLEHRQLKPAINGHVAWTLMNASGNRGDDIRALRLCEMQPHEFMHPNNETSIFAVLGLQSDQDCKTRSKAMRTTINPSYTCFLPHRNPEMCPIGALALLMHYLHDYAKIEDKLDIDYNVNKSWRNVRLLHGSSLTTPYNENALHNLFILSYKNAEIESRLKQHLARHILGYKQEQMGVDASQTSKLGWSRDTYHNTYQPALPKKAILAAHGYKDHEVYDPSWRKVDVPDDFLRLVFPEAEERVKLLDGREQLKGTTNYWKMAIKMRPILFQVAAAIYQVRPKSAIFRLPALANPQVRHWMEEVFPAELALHNAAAGEPINIERIQDATIRQALEQVRHQTTSQKDAIRGLTSAFNALAQKFDRRTVQWTPAKAIAFADQQGSQASTSAPALNAVARQLVFDSATAIDSEVSQATAVSSLANAFVMTTANFSSVDRDSEDTGMYYTPDEHLRGYAVPSPKSPAIPRLRTPIDLVLPHLSAFHEPGEDLNLNAPIFGTESVTWPMVFSKIKQPGYLWNSWKPSDGFDKKSVKEIWTIYNEGEAVFDGDGQQTGLKPPLRIVEGRFNALWRSTDAARKSWQRFREIPEWIDQQISTRTISAEAAIQEVEAMRQVPGKTVLLGTNALSGLIAKARKEAAQLQTQPVSESTGAKKRAAAYGARSKAKRAKTVPSSSN